MSFSEKFNFFRHGAFSFVNKIAIKHGKNAPVLCIGQFFRNPYVVKNPFEAFCHQGWGIFSFRWVGNPVRSSKHQQHLQLVVSNLMKTPLLSSLPQSVVGNQPGVTSGLQMKSLFWTIISVFDFLNLTKLRLCCPSTTSRPRRPP